MYGGKLRFKFDWAGLQWEGNWPFLLCFTSYSRANSKYKPPGGLIFGGACTCKGLFSEFYCSRFPHVGESKTGFHSMDSGFQVLDSSLCQWNLDPGFQSLVGFRIP